MDIGRRANRTDRPVDLLRGHPGGRSEPRPLPRQLHQRSPLRRLVTDRAEAEVAELDRKTSRGAIGGDDRFLSLRVAQKDVFRLDVAVADAGRVGHLQPFGDRQHDRRGEPWLDRPRAGREPCGETAAVAILFGDVAKPVALAELVDRHDSGVVEPRGQFRLAQEPRAKGLRNDHPGMSHLQCYRATQERVDTFVDRGKSPPPRLTNDLETAESLHFRKRLHATALPVSSAGLIEAEEEIDVVDGERTADVSVASSRDAGGGRRPVATETVVEVGESLALRIGGRVVGREGRWTHRINRRRAGWPRCLRPAIR